MKKEYTTSARGHEVYFDGTKRSWFYADDDSLYWAEGSAEDAIERDCALCKKPTTKDGHDPCLANLPGVKYACCGHGNKDDAYIYFENGIVVRNFEEIYNKNDEQLAKNK